MTLSTITKIRTHNLWMLTFSVFWVVAFVALGIWQVNRGLEKQQQFSAIHDLAPPITSMRELVQATAAGNSENLNGKHNGKLSDKHSEGEISHRNAELFFRPIKLTGRFLQKSFLLDNSIFYDMQLTNGDKLKSPYCFLLGDCGRKTGKVRVGYRVFSLFAPTDGLQVLLVERGWLETGPNRNKLPDISQATIPSDELLIDAIVMPRAGKRRVLKADILDSNSQWQILQSIDATALSDKLQVSIYPHPLIMTATSAAAMPKFAPLANYSYLNPARHFGYAVQWFLMALALFSIYLVFYHKNNTGPSS